MGVSSFEIVLHCLFVGECRKALMHRSTDIILHRMLTHSSSTRRAATAMSIPAVLFDKSLFSYHPSLMSLGYLLFLAEVGPRS